MTESQTDPNQNRDCQERQRIASAGLREDASEYYLTHHQQRDEYPDCSNDFVPTPPDGRTRSPRDNQGCYQRSADRISEPPCGPDPAKIAPLRISAEP